MKTVVIKIGTSSILDDNTFLPKLSTLSNLVETIYRIKAVARVVLVSSGAIGFGMMSIGLKSKPKQLEKKQALAAIGQSKIMALYDNLFSQFGIRIAQVLLTRSDISDRSRYLNACNTFNELLSMGVIPIVNENDTVSVAEIKFGDNDTLSAITAAMVKAEILFLLTDVDCLYSDNPRINTEAKPVFIVEDVKSLQANVKSGGSNLGTGGMQTKVVAAKLATAAGVRTVVTSSKDPSRIVSIMDRIEKGQLGSEELKFTIFLACTNAVKDRKWWILHLNTTGKIVIDSGAYKAICKKAALFAAGITGVEGEFQDSEAVSIEYRSVEIGKGITNYNSEDLRKIKGRNSSEIRFVLGYDVDCDECVISRDNLTVTDSQQPFQ